MLTGSELRFRRISWLQCLSTVGMRILQKFHSPPSPQRQVVLVGGEMLGNGDGGEQ